MPPHSSEAAPDPIRRLAAHAPAVRAHLRGRIPARFRSVLDEEDIVQVTFLEACIGVTRNGGELPEPVAAWLRSIADHNLTDAIRELSRAKRPDPLLKRSLDSDQIGRDGALLSHQSPSREVAKGEAHDALADALAQLPDDYRNALQWFDIDGLDIDEVARRLGRSVGATHMLRLRGRDRLRDTLGPRSAYLTRA